MTFFFSVPTQDTQSPVRIASHSAAGQPFTDISNRENTQCPLLDSIVSSFTNDEGQTFKKKKQNKTEKNSGMYCADNECILKTEYYESDVLYYKTKTASLCWLFELIFFFKYSSERT